MPLEEYGRKRRFGETPEPEAVPGLGADSLRFVVQKHRASSLHYDFRLEWAGVLKSWALPKGPSLDPGDKRLAVMVEDHPLDYRLFEGVIPKGNYGAGTVMVWDLGTYRARRPGIDRADDERIMEEGFQKGHITFVLEGKKLKGEFALLKLQRGEKNAWLLVKKKDKGASEEDVRKQDRSALTDRTMDEIARGAEALGEIWLSEDVAHKEVDLGDAPEAEMPRNVKPMLASPVSEAFDREGWLFEIKWDGYRAISEIEPGKIRLYSRTGQPFEQRYPEIVRSLAGLHRTAVLDGELVVVDKDGRPSFELLQRWGELREGALAYYVFDLLYLDGHDLRGNPLARRKQILHDILPPLSKVRFSDHVEEQGKALYQIAESKGLEGVIGKSGKSPYREGRRGYDWLKVKAQRRQDAVIAGFTEPRGSRQGLGALILGVYSEPPTPGDEASSQTNGKLAYIGHAGTGFTDRTLADLRAKLDPLIRPTPPFATVPLTNAPATWVEPRLVCTVTFKEWTRDGVMRMPVFMGLREDVPAESVTREKIQPPEVVAEQASSTVAEDEPDPAASESENEPEEVATRRKFTLGGARADKSSPYNSSKEAADDEKPRRTFTLLKKEEQMEIDGRQVKLSNLKKVFFPRDRYTKGDLIAYYREVAPVILPYLVDRPESLNRHPDGIDGESFFHKDMRGHLPDWVKTIYLHSDVDDREIEYLLCQDEATLVYMANLGCIEINPWSSRIVSLDRPDFMFIDLDPEAVPFQRVIETALVVREVFEQCGIESLVKTSGATGMHVAIPLGARLEYAQARQLGHIIAQIVNRRIPQWTSLVRKPSERQGKVYLDYLQNRRGQTIAAPYSVRPRDGAPVSTPLRWEEVTPKLDPSAFNVRTMEKRLEQVGDLWIPVLGEGVKVEALLAKLGEVMAAESPAVAGR
jgi:bifunctional non-homologous end joining protein LigD